MKRHNSSLLTPLLSAAPATFSSMGKPLTTERFQFFKSTLFVKLERCLGRVGRSYAIKRRGGFGCGIDLWFL